MADRSELRILIVDDDPAIVKLLSAVLVGDGFSPPATAVTGGDALRAARETDIILLDHELPDMTGIAVLERLSHLAAPPSVVLITGRGDESVAAAALRYGAVDYLVKDQSLARLVPQVIERARRTGAIREELAEAERDLVNQERQAALGEMTVTLHHEINNPLMSALVEVELLTQEKLTEVQSDGLRRVKAALQRIRDIVRRVARVPQDSTVEYLDGMRMLDLETPGAVAQPTRGRALLLVLQDPTARVVASLLGRAGFAVTRCGDVAELVRQVRSDPVELVVVGPSNTPGTNPLEGFPPKKDHGFKLVVLLSDEGETSVTAKADRVIRLPFDPATFVAEIDTTLS